MQKKGSNFNKNLQNNSGRRFRKAFLGLFIVFIVLFVISEFNIINRIINPTAVQNIPDKQINQAESTEQLYDPTIHDLDDIEDNFDYLLENNLSENESRLDSEAFNHLRSIQRDVEAYIQTVALSDMFMTKLTTDGLHILLYTDDIFHEGAATFQKGMGKKIKNVGEYLTLEQEHDIYIVGHANDYMKDYKNITSNSDLSGIRALQIKEILSGVPDLDTMRFTSIARGDNDPFVTTITKDTKHLNRRVEIIIQPKIS